MFSSCLKPNYWKNLRKNCRSISNCVPGFNMGHVDQIFSLGSVIQQAHESCLILTMHKSLGGNLPSKPRPGQIFFSTKWIFNEKDPGYYSEAGMYHWGGGSFFTSHCEQINQEIFLSNNRSVTAAKFLLRLYVVIYVHWNLMFGRVGWHRGLVVHSQGGTVWSQQWVRFCEITLL